MYFIFGYLYLKSVLIWTKKIETLVVQRVPRWLKIRQRPVWTLVVVSIIIFVWTRTPPTPDFEDPLPPINPPINPELVLRIRNASFHWKEQCNFKESGHGKSMAILVLSARHHFHERMLIRRTWGSIQKLGNWSIAVQFVVAELGPDVDPQFDLNLKSEGDFFHDIISKRFEDSYRHLTIKSILAYEWLVEYCPNAKVMVKTDDDVVINMFRLVEELEHNRVVDSSKFFCYLHADRQPIRNPREFWYVSPKEYPDDDYPPFCAGIGYVTTMLVVRKVVRVLPSFNRTLWIEDNFLTGLAPQRYNSLLEAELLRGNGTDEDEAERHRKELFFRREKIRFLNMARSWFFWPGGSKSDNNNIVRMWLQNDFNSNNETEKIFTDYFLTKIFYLIDHGPFFEEDFLRLWKKINKHYTFVQRNVTS